MTRREDKYNESEELLDRLFEGLSENADVNLIQEELINSGIDMEKTIEDGQEIIASFLKRQKLAKGRAKFERIKKALADLHAGVTPSVEKARDAIARAVAGESSGHGFQVAHRKLESIEIEDLESLQDDAAILEFVLKFEEDEEGR